MRSQAARLKTKQAKAAKPVNPAPPRTAEALQHIAEKFQPAAAAAATPSAQAHPARILLVDDEPSVLATLAAILEREGYEVFPVGDGEAALEAVRSRSFDLVLTDMKMPRLDGLELLAEVQKSCPLTVTILMTGYASIDSAMQALQLGAYEYLLKPTDINELKSKVKRSLERKQLSEMDALYRLNNRMAGTLNAREIRAAVAETAQTILKLKNVEIVPVRENNLLLCGDGAIQSLMCRKDVHDRLLEGAVVRARAASPLLDPGHSRNVALVPGFANGSLVCVLSADNGEQPYEFHSSALRFLEGIANQAAMSLANLNLIRELQLHNRHVEEANERLRELDNFKSRFLSMATHELRTPLSVIMGYNGMLTERLKGSIDAETSATLDESIYACKRLLKMVNNLLDIRQIETGKMSMNFALTDVNGLIEESAREFRLEAQENSIALAVALPREPLRAVLDAERVHQALTNLIGNALKFTPAGGQVQVSARAAEFGAVEIEVKDSGIGISEADKPKLFREFSRLQPVQRERSQRSKVQGSGLGLTIVKRIAEAHNGSVEVESAPGKGSRFTLKLRAAARSDGKPLAKSQCA